MTAKRKFKSPAIKAIHSVASGLFSVDAIPRESTRDFDPVCIDSVDELQPVEITAYSRRPLSE